MDKIPYLIHKGTSNYWQPGPTVRELGFCNHTLDDDLAIARRQAIELNRQVAQEKLRWHTKPVVTPGTLNHLVTVYLASDDYTDLRDTTRKRYRQLCDSLRQDMGKAKLKTITPKVVTVYKKKLKATPHEANYRLRVLRLLFAFARREGLFDGQNPASDFRQLKVQPRNVVWSMADETAFLAHASPEITRAYLMAIYTAQRQGDLLRCSWRDLRNGTLYFKQSKTDKELEIPVYERLAVALEHTPRTATTILTDSRGIPWKGDWFRHSFIKTVKRAGLTDRRFMDLRRTAIVRLAEAGSEIAEIASVSGHAVHYCQDILETYLPRTRALAARAVGRMT